MSMIDLSQLPAPAVVRPLNFEAELSRLKALVLADLPNLQEVLELESEPVNKVLQLMAYEHVTMQARINDAAKATMLAYAEKEDLEHKAADLGVSRLIGEPDERLRRRAQMALEGITVAGTEGGYKFHALSAHPDVKDVGIDSPVGGTVRVTVLSTQGDGTPSPELLDTVRLALNAQDVRPLTDTVITQAAQVLPYQVRATLVTYPGPAAATVLAAARAALDTYLQERKQLGHDITRSGIYACLHQAGVQNVQLHAPTADLIVQSHQSPHCIAIELGFGGEDV